jgi:beta-galactosidase
MTFNFGSAWYPEWEPDGEWEKDLVRMREAGLDTVRICEFSWEHFEPRPGEFFFDLYDKVVGRCEETGIKVVLGIDTVRPPAWFFERYPDMLLVDQRGEPGPGTWPMHCFSHPAFAEASAPLIERFVSRYRSSKALLYYQLDNEPAYHLRGSHRSGSHHYCYCVHCRAAFRAWIERRYAGRRAPRLAVPFPEPDVMGELLWLEWRRFHDRTNIRRVEWVAAEVKRHDPGHPVTTNIMVGSQFGPHASLAAHDVYGLGRPLDVYGMDIYTDVRRDYRATDAMIYSISDRLGGAHGYHCLETQPTTMAVAEGGWQTQDRGYRKYGDDRRLVPWGWRPLAFGARSLLYWVWRLQYPNVWALARPDGTVNEFAVQTRRLAGEFAKAWPAIDGSELLPSDVAILHNRDTIHLAARQGLAEVPGESVQGAFAACWSQRILPDVLDDGLAVAGALGRYKVVLAPFLLVVSEPLARVLKDYVERGGTLVWDARSFSYVEGMGGFSEYSGSSQWKINMSTVPGGGFDALGAHRVLASYAVDPASPSVASLTAPLGGIDAGAAYRAHALWDDLEATASAEVLARFADGGPALVSHAPGSGRIVACATDICRAAFHGDEPSAALVAAIARSAGATPWASVADVPPELERQLEVVLRRKDGRLLLFALNANPEPVSPRIALSQAVTKGRDLVTGSAVAVRGGREVELALEPYQVAVVRLEA